MVGAEKGACYAVLGIDAVVVSDASGQWSTPGHSVLQVGGWIGGWGGAVLLCWANVVARSGQIGMGGLGRRNVL